MHHLNTAAAVYIVWKFDDGWIKRNGPKSLGKTSGSIDFHSNSVRFLPSPVKLPVLEILVFLWTATLCSHIGAAPAIVSLPFS